MDNENDVPNVERMTLHTEGLVKRYGKRTVASDVSIDVKQGEIVGLLGPNGAGKTTTFYMTTGLIVPNAGKVFLNDLDITDYPVYKRARAGIGYLPQEASVFRKLSVEDNIMAILQMTKLTRQEQLEKLEMLIKEFRLEKVRKNKGDQLSGGERRRTEIARCLAIAPKFIMLDEPFAGVDPIAVEDIQHIVWQLKYRNIGILITDHNVQETLTITDRAYLLFEGRILFQGKPEELAANKIVREKYLSNSFVLRKKDFQYIDEQKRARDEEEREAEKEEENADSVKPIIEDVEPKTESEEMPKTENEEEPKAEAEEPKVDAEESKTESEEPKTENEEEPKAEPEEPKTENEEKPMVEPEEPKIED
jgi:lipopolysaccharide export system ATP-binding protein